MLFSMARLIQTLNNGDGGFPVPFTQDFDVYAGAVGSIIPGMLVISDASHPGYVIAAPDATDTDDIIVGVACSTSTDTVAGNGTVSIETAPYLLVNIFAKTPGSLTQALKLDLYNLDVTAGSYTLDQGTTTKGIFRLFEYDNTTTGKCIASIKCSIWGAIA